jgi:hypothetical protein
MPASHRRLSSANDGIGGVTYRVTDFRQSTQRLSNLPMRTNRVLDPILDPSLGVPLRFPIYKPQGGAALLAFTPTGTVHRNNHVVQ